MTNSIALDTMVTVINLYLVYLYVKKLFEGKIGIKVTSIVIHMYCLLTKSLANCTIGQDIIILDPLEPTQIKNLPVSIYIWSKCDRFCDIYKTYDFYIQSPCLYKYGDIFPFIMSNNGCIWFIHMALLINNDISTYFVCKRTRMNFLPIPSEIIGS
eukprot:42369_1